MLSCCEKKEAKKRDKKKKEESSRTFTELQKIQVAAREKESVPVVAPPGMQHESYQVRKQRFETNCMKPTNHAVGLRL